MKITKRKSLPITAITAACMFLFLGGCKKDTHVQPESVCPIVEATNPANQATGVPLNQVITATFNEKMDPETITQESFILQGASRIAGTLSYDETNNKINFVPTTPLMPNTTYSGRVVANVKDLTGNALQTDYLWSFSTGATLAPLVIFTDPLNNATSVALNKTISATFNMPMNPATLNALNFVLKQGNNTIAGTISYSGTTAYFVPSALLIPNSAYSSTVSTGARNTFGTALANNYVWTFTTGILSAPIVVSTDPSNGTNGVVLNKVITATFSEAMNPLTINSANFILKQGTTLVTGTVSYLGTTASFTPSSNLLPGTIYTATISTGAKNLAGTSMANDYIWNFSTLSTGTINPAPGVDLKSVARFGIIAGVGVGNNAGFSEIHNMDVGISPGIRSSITGFPPAIIVNGAIYASDDISPPGIAATLTQAKQDLTDAYLFAEGASSPAPASVSGDLGGTTLAPGIYKSTSTLMIQSGNLTLDAQGNPNAVWIFQVASAFTTIGGAGGNVILIGGAQAKNIYWQTGSSATIGDYTSFSGNILALTSITMNSGATATGRMLARNGSVVLTNTNFINKP